MSGSLYAGIDIGGTKSLAVVIDADGAVTAQLRRASGFGARHVVENAVDTVQHLAASLGRRPHELRGLGIGIPGLVEHRIGVVAQAVNLGIESLPLADELAERLGMPVRVENDVNAAALAIADSLGATAAGRSLAFLNLGTGIAAGLILDGRLWRGSSGGAGEIGHTPAESGGLRCGCGQLGCLETVASGSGLAQQWGGPITASELLRLAEDGDERAVRVHELLVWGVATAVRQIVLTAEVERVVLGGGLGQALGADGLLTPLQARLRAWEASSPFLATLALARRVELASAGAPYPAIGAALAVRDDGHRHSRQDGR